jgi:hypothetical protein
MTVFYQDVAVTNLGQPPNPKGHRRRVKALSRFQQFAILSGTFIGVMVGTSIWNHRLGLALLALVAFAAILVGIFLAVLVVLSAVGVGRTVDTRSPVPNSARVVIESGPTILIGHTVMSDRQADMASIQAAMRDVATHFPELRTKRIRLEALVPITLLERLRWKVDPPAKDIQGQTMIWGPPLVRIRKELLKNARKYPMALRHTMSHEVIHLLQHQFKQCHQPSVPWSVLHKSHSEKLTELFTLARVGESFPFPPPYLDTPRSLKTVRAWVPESSRSMALAQEAIRGHEQGEIRDPVDWWEKSFAAGMEGRSPRVKKEI